MTGSDLKQTNRDCPATDATWLEALFSEDVKSWLTLAIAERVLFSKSLEIQNA